MAAPEGARILVARALRARWGLEHYGGLVGAQVRLRILGREVWK